MIRPHVRYVQWKYDDMESARSRTGPPAAPPAMKLDEERSLRAGAVVGTPKRVVDRIRGFARIAGGDLHYIARMYWPGIHPGRQRELMGVFAESVIPALRESGM
jgi:alkanesulfonate monooxygenase SsuD/methylene tetrahydromethanopterin reductase-like flavin-dependent oxidoreductase (luciferase family)